MPSSARRAAALPCAVAAFVCFFVVVDADAVQCFIVVFFVTVLHFVRTRESTDAAESRS